MNIARMIAVGWLAFSVAALECLPRSSWRCVTGQCSRACCQSDTVARRCCTAASSTARAVEAPQPCACCCTQPSDSAVEAEPPPAAECVVDASTGRRCLCHPTTPAALRATALSAKPLPQGLVAHAPHAARLAPPLGSEPITRCHPHTAWQAQGPPLRVLFCTWLI